MTSSSKLGSSTLAYFSYAGMNQFVRDAADFEAKMLMLSIELDLPIDVTIVRFNEYWKSTPYDWRECLACVYVGLPDALEAMTGEEADATD